MKTTNCSAFPHAFRLSRRSVRTRVRLIRERKSQALLPWLERAKACPYEELRRFALVMLLIIKSLEEPA